MRLEEIERDRKREEERRKKKEEELRKAELRKAEQRKAEELKAEEQKRMLEEHPLQQQQQQPEAEMRKMTEEIQKRQIDAPPVPLTADDEDVLLNEAIRLSLMDANAIAAMDQYNCHDDPLPSRDGYIPILDKGEQLLLDPSDSDSEQIH